MATAVCTSINTIAHGSQLSDGDRGIQNSDILLDSIHDLIGRVLLQKNRFNITVGEDVFFENNYRGNNNTKVKDQILDTIQPIDRTSMAQEFNSGKLQIKDVFITELFIIGFNNFIDSAESSIETCLKYHKKTPGSTNITLPFDSASNTGTSFGQFGSHTYTVLYDKALFWYFTQGTGNTLGVAPPIDTTYNNWNPTTFRERHAYIMNCVWQKTLEYIQNRVQNIGNQSLFNINDFNQAISLLRELRFVNFSKKYTTLPGGVSRGYKDYVYNKAMFTWNGETSIYPFDITQKTCAIGIQRHLINISPRDKSNIVDPVDGRKGKSRESKLKTLIGLEKLFNSKIGARSGFEPKHAMIAYVLLKFSGDSSHLVMNELFRTINTVTNPPPLNYRVTEVSIYLSERPLLARSVQNCSTHDVYFKEIAYFSKLYPTSGDDVYKYTTDPRAANAKFAQIRATIEKFLNEQTPTNFHSIKDEDDQKKQVIKVLEIFIQGNINNQADYDRVFPLGQPDRTDFENLLRFIRLYESMKHLALVIENKDNDPLIKDFIEKVVPSSIVHGGSRNKRKRKFQIITEHLSNFYDSMRNKKKHLCASRFYDFILLPLEALYSNFELFQKFASTRTMNSYNYFKYKFEEFGEISEQIYQGNNEHISNELEKAQENLDGKTKTFMIKLLTTYRNIKDILRRRSTTATVVPIRGGSPQLHYSGGSAGMMLDTIQPDQRFQFDKPHFSQFYDHRTMNDPIIQSFFVKISPTTPIDYRQYYINRYLRSLQHYKNISIVFNEQENDDITSLEQGEIVSGTYRMPQNIIVEIPIPSVNKNNIADAFPEIDENYMGKDMYYMGINDLVALYQHDDFKYHRYIQGIYNYDNKQYEENLRQKRLRQRKPPTNRSYKKGVNLANTREKRKTSVEETRKRKRDNKFARRRRRNTQTGGNKTRRNKKSKNKKIIKTQKRENNKIKIKKRKNLRTKK